MAVFSYYFQSIYRHQFTHSLSLPPSLTLSLTAYKVWKMDLVPFSSEAMMHCLKSKSPSLASSCILVSGYCAFPRAVVWAWDSLSSRPYAQSHSSNIPSFKPKVSQTFPFKCWIVNSLGFEGHLVSPDTNFPTLPLGGKISHGRHRNKPAMLCSHPILFTKTDSGLELAFRAGWYFADLVLEPQGSLPSASIMLHITLSTRVYPFFFPQMEIPWR